MTIANLVLVLPLLLGAVVLAGVTVGVGAAEDHPALRVALVSDTHTNLRHDDPDQGRYKGHLERVMADVNAAKVDVVLIAGDLTQGGRPEEMDDFNVQIKGFHGPVRYVPGNHDVGDKHLESKPGAGVTSARVANYEKHFGASWWTETFGGMRVIGVNSSIIGSSLPEEATQWTFLERELSRADSPPTLLLMHYPPFLKTPDEPGGGYWNIEPAPRARLLALVQKPEAHVVGILTGHLHRANDAHLGPIRIVTTPPVSFGLPAGKQAEGWTLVAITPQNEVITDFRPVIPESRKVTKP